MKIFKDSFKKSIKLHGKKNGYYYSLPELEKKVSEKFLIFQFLLE